MTDHRQVPENPIVEVSEDWTIAAPASAVWNKVCEPCSLLEWHGDVETCERSLDDKGRLARTYVMKQAGRHPAISMFEVELLRSDPIMTIAYIVDVKNLPITDYHAQMTVTPLTKDSCQARIRSRFVSDQASAPGFNAQDFVSKFYKRGLSRLCEIMEAG